MKKTRAAANIKKINQILRSRPNPVDRNNNNQREVYNKKEISHVKSGSSWIKSEHTRVKKISQPPPLSFANKIIVIKFCILFRSFGGNITFENSFSHRFEWVNKTFCGESFCSLSNINKICSSIEIILDYIMVYRRINDVM